MIATTQIKLLLCTLCAVFLTVLARPDSGGHVPLPGPGLSYGGIPYGSVSGNVAEFFQRQSPPGGRSSKLQSLSPEVDISFAPIEQWLR